MTDQQNASTVRTGKVPRAITPHLDTFKNQAVSFNQAFSPSPHCCPSRASFFTGKYPSEHGVWNNVNVTNALSRGPRKGTHFWSTDFLAAGYDLGFSGKWHVSNFQQPRDFGWEELIVTAAGSGVDADSETQRREARARELADLQVTLPGVNKQGVASKSEPGEIIRPGWPRYVHYGVDEDPFDDAAVVDAAKSYILSKTTKNTPWCLYTGTLGPHDPYTPPQRFLDWYSLEDIQLPPSFNDDLLDKPGLYSRTRMPFNQLTAAQHREALRHYLAFCSYEDELFGHLLQALGESGQRDNTLVLYLSDHGDYAAEHGLWGKGLPAFQSAYRVPLIIGGPGIADSMNGQETEHHVSLVDVGPALLELCNVKPESDLSGNSFASLLSGRDKAAIARDLFFQTNGNEAYGIQRVIISEEWKLVYNMFDHDELYHLQNDPEELVNLLGSSRAYRVSGQGPLDHIPQELRNVVQQLYARLWAFGLAHEDDIINGYILTALAPVGPGISSN